MTKKQFENQLNQEFDDMGGFLACEKLEYLTNPTRGEYCCRAYLGKMAALGRLGSVLRRLDPIAFEVRYNEETRARAN